MSSWKPACLCGLLALAAAPAAASAGVKLIAPAQLATVLELSPRVEAEACGPLEPRRPLAEARLDGAKIRLDWARTPYAGRWLARLPRLAEGRHTLEVSARCLLGRARSLHRFEVARRAGLEPAWALARHYEAGHPAGSQSWDWDTGIFLYGLQRLTDASGGGASDYVHDYHVSWARKGTPAPDRSDSCPPALSALQLLRDHDDAAGLGGIGLVAEYLRTEPRNSLGSLNHLGHAFVSYFFPRSIWVDSLMMTGVFAAQWGDATGDAALRDFGVAQPGIFASVLQDGRTGLFRHAWKTTHGGSIPTSPTFWLRGNGWVLASIAEILEHVAPGSAEAEKLTGIFTREADGVLAFQLPSGLWDSVLNLPGFTYEETSGSALVAYALARGVHRGWLPPAYLAPARAAFAAVTARLQAAPGGASMPWISGATEPGPRWTYAWVMAVHDAPYGIGAYLLAASELSGEIFE